LGANWTVVQIFPTRKKSMKVALIKYNAGNVQSVCYALERLGVEAELTDDPQKISTADRVIFPGQGEASSAMSYLKERNLDQVIRDVKQPFLGVCLGLQLLCTHSEENNTTCLGIFPQLVNVLFQVKAGRKKCLMWVGIRSRTWCTIPYSRICPTLGTYTMCTVTMQH